MTSYEFESRYPHGFVYPQRNSAGAYAPDAVQKETVADALAFFARHRKT